MPPKRQRAETATSAEEPKRRSTRNTRSSAAETTTPEETKPATTTTRKSAAKKAEPKKKSPAASAAPAEKKDEPKPTATSDDDSAAREPRFWLLKAEPETRIEKGKDVKFSIDDLAAMKEPAAWDGVRNYGARNNMRAMRKGDLAFFYHSNCKNPGIVGVMEIVGEATIDETAFDPKEPYYDPKSSRDAPKWDVVHVEFRRKLRREIGLQELKKYKDSGLKEMPLLKMGRLSVSEVPKVCWDFVLELEKRDEE